MSRSDENAAPSLLRWSLGLAASAGLTGMICCVAPMVLFMFGLMGGAYAISFADFFYTSDGSPGTGAWVLRGVAVLVGAAGAWQYRTRQQLCAIDPKQQQKNLLLLCMVIAIFGVGFFLSLESLSAWYFDAYIVPAQQRELGLL